MAAYPGAGLAQAGQDGLVDSVESPSDGGSPVTSHRRRGVPDQALAGGGYRQLLVHPLRLSTRKVHLTLLWI